MQMPLKRFSQFMLRFLVFLMVQIVSAQPAPAHALKVDHVIYDVVWSPNGKWLVVAFDDGIGIYTSSLQEITQIKTGEVVSRVTWSADSNWFASVSNDPTVKIWHWGAETKTLMLARTITNSHSYSFVTSASWSPDGKWLAVLAQTQYEGSTTVGGTVEIWNTQTWTLRNSLPDEQLFIAPFITWSPDSRDIATVANTCIPDAYIYCDLPYIYVADTVTGQLIYQSSIYINTPQDLVWSSQNRLALATDDSILILDAATQQIVASYPNASPQGHFELTLDWSSDGKTLVTAYLLAGDVRFFDPATGSLISEVNIGSFNVMDLSPDDRLLATADTSSGLISVWNIDPLPVVSGVPTVTPLPTLTPSPTVTPTKYPIR